MNCHRVKSLLLSFLEGELSLARKEEVEAHLKACAACRQEKELLFQSWQMLDKYAEPKLKDDFTSSLMRKIHAQQAEIVNVTYRLPNFSFRLLAPVFASFLIVVLVSSIFWKSHIDKQKLAKITPRNQQEIAAIVADEEIIRNLDIYENAELLKNLKLISELDVVEGLEESAS